MNTKMLEQTYELAVYPRRDIVLVSGKGKEISFDFFSTNAIFCIF